LKAEGIVLAAVDTTAEENKELGTQYEVKGFPTLKVYNVKTGSGFSDYEGGRTHDAIVE